MLESFKIPGPNMSTVKFLLYKKKLKKIFWICSNKNQWNNIFSIPNIQLSFHFVIFFFFFPAGSLNPRATKVSLVHDPLVDRVFLHTIEFF